MAPRRGAGCLIVVLVLLVVVCGVGAVGDRVLAHVVDGRLTTAVAQNLKSNGTPARTTKVETTGFPFVTQLLSGTFDGANVHLTGLQTPEGVAIDKVDVTLKDVKVPRDVLRGAHVHDVTAGSIAGTGQVSVKTIADRLGLPDLKLVSASGNALKASYTADVPIVGSVRLTADVTPKLTKNALTFTVANASLGSYGIPQEILDSVTNAFARPIQLDLPFAVRLDKVTASGGFLNVSGSASNVSLVN